MGWMEQRKSKPRAQQRAAGTKKTALFDMVNRNITATRLVMGRAREGARRHAPPSRPGQARASVPLLCTVAIRAREPGPRATRRAASLLYAVSGSRGVYPRAARSADPGARPGHESARPLLHPDICRADHLAPALGLLLDEGLDRVGRAADRGH